MSDITQNKDKVYKHWATVISEQAIERFGNEKHTIATGWSPSGYYHIGNFREGVTCRAIAKELDNLGCDTSFIINIDDLDPFDKIPSFFKKEYGKTLKDYIGMPICQVPDPLDCHTSYAEHFTDNALEIMGEFDVNPEPILTSEAYKKGNYDKYAKLFLEKKEQVFKLTEEITGSKMEDFFLVQCPKCKNIAAPKITNHKITEGDIFVELHCQRQKRGCDHKGEIRLGETLWKLKWRLDWAARQHFIGVTVEDSGKDHGVAGGSVDTAIAIHKQIFEKRPPILTQHGFITFAGKKLSGSSGSGIPVSEFPKILDPATFLYKIYRNNIRRDFDFNVARDVPSTSSDFDEAEELFYQEKEHEHEKTAEKTIKAYELALMTEPPQEKPIRVDYSHLVTVMQVCLYDFQSVLERLQMRDLIPKNPSKDDEKRIFNRYERAKYWLKKYADATFKFMILEEPNCEIVKKLDQKMCETLYSIVEDVRSDMSAKEITQHIYEYAKSEGHKPRDLFQAFYSIILGEKYGPRAGTLIDALGKEETLNLIKKALECK